MWDKPTVPVGPWTPVGPGTLVLADEVPADNTVVATVASNTHLESMVAVWGGEEEDIWILGSNLSMVIFGSSN